MLETVSREGKGMVMQKNFLATLEKTFEKK